MEAEFDIRAELARGVADAAGAWQFIRLFAARYVRPVVAGDGCDDAELSEAETRLGFPLPASLRAAYALIGRRPDLTRAQDRLLAPHQLDVDHTGRVLVFRWECQHVVEWGTPLSAVAEPDPPVVFRHDWEPVWQPFLERLSLACVEMVLSEWMLCGAASSDSRQLDNESVALLERRFRRLPMPGYPFWAGSDDAGPVRWFEGYGAILREDAGTWLWASGASPDAIAAVRRSLPGEWTTNEG